MEFFADLWRGRVSLGLVFWLFGPFMLVMMRLLEVVGASISPAAGKTAFLISLLYYCFFSIVLWRTALHYDEDPIYPRLARMAMFVWWVRYLYSAFV